MKKEALMVAYDETEVEGFEDDAKALYEKAGAPVDLRAANWIARMQFEACTVGYPRARQIFIAGMKTGLGLPQDDAAPAPAPQAPINGNYQDWFRGLTANGPQQWAATADGIKPAQDYLNSLEGVLAAAGVALTPANANGDRTKIGIPVGNGQRQVIRVGFGEGKWVWFDLGVIDWP